MKSIDFENRRKGQKLLPSSLSSAKKDKEDIYIFENGEDKLRNAESGKGIEDECEGNRRNKEIIEIMSLDQAGKSNIVPPSKQGNGAEIHFKWEKGRQAWLNEKKDKREGLAKGSMGLPKDKRALRNMEVIDLYEEVWYEEEEQI